MSTKPRAYSYLRFSTPEQMKGDSLRRQTELAERYAHQHGLELDQELNLRDLGVSAFRGANLETGALGAFLKAVRDGIVEPGSFLLVESLDRVSRKSARKAVRILEEIVEAGVTVVTLNDGRAYTEESLDSFDFVMAVVILLRAHEESATKAKRLKAAWHGKRQRIGDGLAVTALTPGWIKLDADRKPVLIEERAKIVRRIVRDFLRGIGRQSIAKALNQEGVEPWGIGRRKGMHWHQSYVAKLIRNPALVGTFIPHTETYDKDGKLVRVPQEPVEGYFPPVIDQETFQRLQDAVSAPSVRGRHATAPLQSILSGLARCPECGSTMTRVAKGNRSRPTLVCRAAKIGAAKHYRSVPYELVERTVLGQFGAILDGMPHPNEQVEQELSAARAAVDGQEARLAALLDTLERHPSDSLAKRVQDAEVALKAQREALDDIETRAAHLDSKAIRLRCEALGVAIRARPVDRARINAALRELVESVTIDYNTGHMRFRWRSGGESSVIFMWPDVTREVDALVRKLK